MSFIPLPRVVMHAGDDREAPSSIVNACTSQARWHLVTGLVCCGVAGLLFWGVYEMAESARIISEVGGPGPALPISWQLAWGGEFSLLALTNGLLLFRSYAAMCRLRESRLVSDLHQSLRRVRAVWRMFALSPLLALAPFIVLLVMDWLWPLS